MEIQLSQGVRLGELGTNLLSSTYQGFCLMDLNTSFQARHIKEFVSWISAQAFKLGIN